MQIKKLGKHLNVSAKVKNDKKQKSIQRITLLVPEKGSHPHFLRCAVEFARVLKVSVRLLVSARFLAERPQKGGFYREFLEEHSLQNGIVWDVQVFEDSLPKVLGELSPEEDIVAILKDGDPLLLKILLRESSCPVLVIPREFKAELENVVLAYAGGRFSGRALKIAAELGKRGKCHVEVLTVGASPSPALRVAHERARYYLDLYKVKADHRILKAQVKKTILETCETDRTDLLILGASETKEWKDHRFRSLSQEVAEEAEWPVMVVK